MKKDLCPPFPSDFIASINPSKCEAKGPCVPACPYNVTTLLTLTSEQKTELSFLGKIKAKVHGNKRAFISKPDDCHACGLCVQACPEKAIQLVPRQKSQNLVE